MKKQSLTKNFIFQFLYQGLILVIPLILSPYLTRTLHEKPLGIYTYTNSIAYYFVVLAMLGISRHGQRIISQSSRDETTLRKNFWSLFYVHIIVSIFSVICYVGFVFLFTKSDRTIYLIQTFYVLSALFDITWLFYGLENFKSVVIKNTVIKVSECLLIFLLVKTPDDLWKYASICTVGLLLGQMIMIPQAVRMIKPISVTADDCKQHIKPLLVFSISVIAVSLYTVFDKTLIGIMMEKEDVTYYEYSNKIVTIPKTIISVIGTVMFPRACKFAKLGDVSGQKKYISYSSVCTAFIGMMSISALMAIGTPFAVLYYGDSFAQCGNIIKALSPLIFIIGFGDILRTQYMIPNHLDKQYNICILLNAVVNIILSLSLIPVIGIYGAVVGTVSAEIFGLCFQLVVCRKFIRPVELLRDSVPFILIGGIMFIVMYALQSVFTQSFKWLIVECIIGGTVYLIGTLIYIFFLRKDIVALVTSKIKRRKI